MIVAFVVVEMVAIGAFSKYMKDKDKNNNEKGR